MVILTTNVSLTVHVCPYLYSMPEKIPQETLPKVTTKPKAIKGFSTMAILKGTLSQTIDLEDCFTMSDRLICHNSRYFAINNVIKLTKLLRMKYILPAAVQPPTR